MWLDRAGYAMLSLAVLGCADKTPARIEVAAKSQTIFDDAPRTVGARLVNSKGETLTQPALTYSVTPTSVAEATTDDRIACKSSGDASLVLAGGGQSATVTIVCRLVSEIRAPEAVRLILGRAPGPIQLTAVDREAHALTDVLFNVSLSDPAVAQFVGGSLAPLAVGVTTVTVSAGSARASFPVSVLELVRSEPLAISDGATVTLALQQGNYQLDLKVKAANGSANGVAVSWVGADCADAPEAQVHELTCTVGSTASLTIKNPTAFGLGPSVNGFINLYRGAR